MVLCDPLFSWLIELLEVPGYSVILGAELWAADGKVFAPNSTGLQPQDAMLDLDYWNLTLDDQRMFREKPPSNMHGKSWEHECAVQFAPNTAQPPTGPKVYHLDLGLFNIIVFSLPSQQGGTKISVVAINRLIGTNVEPLAILCTANSWYNFHHLPVELNQSTRPLYLRPTYSFHQALWWVSYFWHCPLQQSCSTLSQYLRATSDTNTFRTKFTT